MPSNQGNWFTRLLDKVTGYRLGGATYMTTMQVPPDWNYEQYLKAYGNIGWLFGVVSVISKSVAEVDWKLYRTRGGKRDVIDSHPLLDLWSHVNPFQTKYQFVLLQEMYVKLVGEAFVVLTLNGRSLPTEMWLAPPQFMHVVPSAKNYIDHYVFTRGQTTIKFAPQEIIHIMEPNPSNPYRGMSAARALGVDLDSERNAARFQNRLFYNDARPGLLLEFPESQGIPPLEERDSIRAEWNSMHRGLGNAFKTGFLWGGAKANMITLSNRDMQFGMLRKVNRDNILGAYHVPQSVMGIGEVGSRARAEADEYIYAKRVVRPALVCIREALNEQLIPMFRDRALEFDFEDPVPENRDAMVKEAVETVKGSIRSREEGRELLGLDRQVDPGDTFVIPTLGPGPAKDLEVRDVRDVRIVTEEQKEARWRAYVNKTEVLEKKFKRAFKKLFSQQRDDIVRRLREQAEAASADSVMFEDDAENEAFVKDLEPVIQNAYVTGYNDAGGEKAVTKQILNELALAWIAKRSLAMAVMVNGTTKSQLRPILATALAEGKGVPKVVKELSQFYVAQYRWRAPLVARTEMIAAHNEGSLQRYEVDGVEKSEFYAALDERTCDECMDFHGQVMPTTEAHGMIPVHPQCRCTWIPVVEG